MMRCGKGGGTGAAWDAATEAGGPVHETE